MTAPKVEPTPQAPAVAVQGKPCPWTGGMCTRRGCEHRYACDAETNAERSRAMRDEPPTQPQAQGDALREALQEAECALSLMVSYGHCEGDREVGRDAAQVRAVDALPRIAAALSSPPPAQAAEAGAPSVRSRDEG
jgi:hypothetical protein